MEIRERKGDIIPSFFGYIITECKSCSNQVIDCKSRTTIFGLTSAVFSFWDYRGAEMVVRVGEEAEWGEEKC